MTLSSFNHCANKIPAKNHPDNGDGNINENKKVLGGLNFSKDYFIYSLEWTKDKLTWKINDNGGNQFEGRYITHKQQK